MDKTIQNTYDVALDMIVAKGAPFTVYDVTQMVRSHLKLPIPHWQYRVYVHDRIAERYDLAGELMAHGQVLYKPHATPLKGFIQSPVYTQVGHKSPVRQTTPKLTYDFAERKVADANGRYTIPAEFVKRVGLQPGDTVRFSVQNGRLVQDVNGTWAYLVNSRGEVRVNTHLLTLDRNQKLTTRVTVSGGIASDLTVMF